MVRFLQLKNKNHGYVTVFETTTATVPALFLELNNQGVDLIQGAQESPCLQGYRSEATTCVPLKRWTFIVVLLTLKAKVIREGRICFYINKGLCADVTVLTHDPHLENVFL